MSFLSKLVGMDASSTITAVGQVADKLFTSDAEKAQAAYLIEQLRQQPHLLQAEINKVEAAHQSTFVAGGRAFIWWVLGIGIAFNFVINPIFQWLTGIQGPVMPTRELMTLLLSLMGLGG